MGYKVTLLRGSRHGSIFLQIWKSFQIWSPAVSHPQALWGHVIAQLAT